MAKRKYTKRSEYWDRISAEGKNPKNVQPLDNILNQQDESEWKPGLFGESFASYNSSNTFNRSGAQQQGNRSRRNHSSTNTLNHRFAHIHAGLLPYTISADGIDVREAIILCQKAYANIAIFRNAIDILSELTNSDIILKGGNESSRDFVSKWFTKIRLRKLKGQYFREYFRSGNIFIYRIDGKFQLQDFKNLNKIYASESLKPGEIPLRYVLLNPYDIATDRTSTFNDGSFKKILSEYEIQNLKNPANEFDKGVFKALPSEVKKMIKDGTYNKDGVSIPLDPMKLITSFYKKQDYEPFAVPFGFPVLDDINRKLELKNMDQAIGRAVQQAILLITMGAEEEKGGVNPNSMKAMQALFQNESVGRVLVSDYTTKAQFVIPDIKKVVGAEKYEILNQDIKEGLQNIITGSEKFANTQTKAKIFLERLKEARDDFINDFLQPQIIEVCRNMGFKNYPVADFVKIDIEDEVQLQRVATRLIELGIITPEQGIDAIKTGVYPESEELEAAQEKYIEQRENGMYNPLVGGVPFVEPAGAEEDRDHALEVQDKQLKHQQKISRETQKQAQKNKQQNPPKENGRPTGDKGESKADVYGLKQAKEVVYKVESLRKFAKEKFKEIHSTKRLSAQKTKLLNEMLEKVVTATEMTDWESTMEACLKDNTNIISLATMPDVSDISHEHQLECFPAAILYHSRNID